MKGNGTPIRYRRTHIPRLTTVLVGYFGCRTFRIETYSIHPQCHTKAYTKLKHVQSYKKKINIQLFLKKEEEK